MKKKIRVLHIAQAAGGVDRYLRSLLKYFDSDNFENILLCSYDFYKEDYAKIVDEFIQINMIREISVKSDICAIKEVRKIIKKFSPDVVYMHSSKAGAIGRIADIGIKNAKVYNPHGWAFNMDCGKKKQTMYRLIEKFLAAFTTQFVCISEAEKISAINNHITKTQKLNVILNGIDIENCNEQMTNCFTRNELGIPEDAFIVGQVGRISKQKSPDVFIKAAAMIKNEIPNAYFVLVGDGDMKDEVLSYAKEHGLSDSITITGWVENPLSYVPLFDVATLLSRWEGFGLVLPEYMLAQKPIVASNVDAIPTIIHSGVNGMLVSMESPRDVCDSIMKIYNDNNFKNTLIKNGNNIVYKNFDAARVSEKHEKLMIKIVGGKNG